MTRALGQDRPGTEKANAHDHGLNDANGIRTHRAQPFFAKVDDQFEGEDDQERRTHGHEDVGAQPRGFPRDLPLESDNAPNAAASAMAPRGSETALQSTSGLTPEGKIAGGNPRGRPRSARRVGRLPRPPPPTPSLAAGLCLGPRK